jgi:hypothetical protein
LSGLSAAAPEVPLDVKEVLQYGSDETGIRGQGSLNQWAKIMHDDNSTEIATIEAGGILVGATAEEVASHFEAT